MEFKIRQLEESDYGKLVGWWKDWGWEAPPQDFLPENGKGGFMVSDDDSDICAGFIYFTNSKVAWMEFIISNKKYKKQRKEAIQYLIDSLGYIIEKENFKYGYAVLKNKSLMNYYEKAGFIKSDENITEMIKVWQQQQQ